jgi:hypothetical protein
MPDENVEDLDRGNDMDPVFHGVDGIGWKSKTSAELKYYFGYINSKQNWRRVRAQPRAHGG